MSLNPEINKVLGGDAPQLVSYSYLDIADGTGITIFYGASANLNGVAITDHSSGAYILTTSPIYSNNIVATTNVNDIGGAYIVAQDLDFDTTFNLPKKIKGKSFISLSHGANTVTGGKTTMSKIEARIKKVSGGVETDLTSASGAALSTPTGQNSKTICLKPTIPLTTFKKGDTLRLSIVNWAANDVTCNAYVGFGIDPQDENDDNTNKTISDTNTTKLEFHVPFVIDV